jgi:hypothetical protein
MPSASKRPSPVNRVARAFQQAVAMRGNNANHRVMKDLMISKSIKVWHWIVLLTAGSYGSLGHMSVAVALP